MSDSGRGRFHLNRPPGSRVTTPQVIQVWRKAEELQDQVDALLSIVRRAAEEPCYCQSAQGTCECLGPLARATLRRFERSESPPPPAVRTICELCQLQSAWLEPRLARFRLEPTRGNSLNVCLSHVCDAAATFRHAAAGQVRLRLVGEG